MHVDLGGYHISDIEFSAAFDVDAEKVGQDLSEAIFARPEQHRQVLRRARAGRQGPARHDPRRHRQVPVQGHHQGPGRDRRRGRHPPGHQDRRRRHLPAGGLARRPPSGTSSRCWPPAARSSTASRCSSPASPTGAAASRTGGLPIIGDDIKSQVGATIVHRVLTRLFRDRGVQLERTHQLNVGGNTDFLNMLERERLESKKISKTNAVTSQLDYDIGADNVHIGPSDYVALAARPQVGLHPARGPLVRRRAPEHRAQARGGRLAQLGRHRDRRRALRQAGARQRPRPARSSGRPRTS